jgi:hypothetical protein
MDGNAIENLDDPTNAQDAATKAYVDAAAPGAGGLVLLASLTASSSSSLDFVNRNASGQSGAIFQSDFDEYLIEFVNVRPATNAAGILGRLSTDGGSTYASTSYYSPYHVVWSGGHTAGNDTTNGFRVSGPCSNTAANGGVSGTMRLYNPLSSVVHKQALLSTANVDTNVSVPVRWDVGAAYQSATACDAFRVIATSGNIADGTVRIYGIKK